MTYREAKKRRADLERTAGMQTDEEALETMWMFPMWSSDKVYSVGDRVRDDSTLYKRIQPQTVLEPYPPSQTPALWVEVAAPGEYREIKDNMLPTEAFALDEIGWYEDKANLYRSTIPNNTYTPVTYPAGWERVREPGVYGWREVSE